MTVYVDDMYRYPMGRFARLKMSHMIADSDAELHAMADRIGVERRWFQDNGSGPHYDVAITKRTLALRFGARAITLRQLAMMNQERRKTGVLLPPNPLYGDNPDLLPSTTDRMVG